MWTNVIDETAGGLCRSLNGMAGHFPSACQVDAGRPALYLTLVGAIALVYAVSFASKRARRVSS